jgi:UPF0271 protein
MNLVRVGDAAWRWELAPGADRAALLDALRTAPGVVDAVVTERHACVVVAPGARFDPARVPMPVTGSRAPREHVVRVRYDGPDIAELAARAGVAPEELVRRHAARTYTVALVGFQPGFAYLREVDPSIAAPRRASPRVRVPAGAVGIAGPYTGVYPFASPGGWNLVGTAVGFTAFDREAGSMLALSDRVRFEPAA